MAETRIHVSRENGLLEIVLGSPERGNTIDHQFTAELVAAVNDLGEIGCVLITAQGRNFCLGGDLVGVGASDDPGRYIDDLARKFHLALGRLDTAGVPVVAAVQGWSAGAGLSLLLAADIVVLEQGARLRTAYAGVGFTPDGGLSWTLPRAVGQARAMDMLLTNRPLDADEALAAGLASRVVPDGTAADTARQLARAIAGGPRRALSTARGLTRAARQRPYLDHLDAERTAIAAQAGGAEGIEGVAAFLERRAPEWAAAGAARIG